MKIALRFILEIKAGKLQFQATENFKVLVAGCKKRTIGTQTLLEHKDFKEVELQDMVIAKYNGEVSVEHFVSCPEDLKVFIEDFCSLQQSVKSCSQRFE